MLFIKSCIQMFLTQYLFLQIVASKWEQKHRVPDTSIETMIIQML